MVLLLPTTSRSYDAWTMAAIWYHALVFFSTFFKYKAFIIVSTSLSNFPNFYRIYYLSLHSIFLDASYNCDICCIYLPYYAKPMCNDKFFISDQWKGTCMNLFIMCTLFVIYYFHWLFIVSTKGEKVYIVGFGPIIHLNDIRLFHSPFYLLTDFEAILTSECTKAFSFVKI